MRLAWRSFEPSRRELFHNDLPYDGPCNESAGPPAAIMGGCCAWPAAIMGGCGAWPAAIMGGCGAWPAAIMGGCSTLPASFIDSLTMVQSSCAFCSAFSKRRCIVVLQSFSASRTRSRKNSGYLPAAQYLK